MKAYPALAKKYAVTMQNAQAADAKSAQEFMVKHAERMNDIYVLGIDAYDILEGRILTQIQQITLEAMHSEFDDRLEANLIGTLELFWFLSWWRCGCPTPDEIEEEFDPKAIDKAIEAIVEYSAQAKANCDPDEPIEVDDRDDFDDREGDRTLDLADRVTWWDAPKKEFDPYVVF